MKHQNRFTVGRWLPVTLLASIGASFHQAQAQTAAPYAMRGVALGITLQEFNTLPSALAEDGYAGTKTVCDPKVGSTTRCRWEATSKYTSSSGTQPVKVGNTGVYPVFVFTDAADGIDRLMLIDIGSNMRYWPDLTAAFTEQFGLPERKLSAVQNGLGAIFDKEALIWQNAASSITLESRCPVLDQVCIKYAHTAIKAADAAKAKQDRGPPKF